MRTEQEMMDLILHTARNDERIRAIYMNGSRTNQNAPKDIFQDYDIVYVVTETKSFYEDASWIDRFGKRLYMQTPEANDLLQGKPCNLEDTYGWLIQFTDGNRLDLHVQSIPYSQKHILEDKLCCILLDKDNILPNIPTATDEDYFVTQPSEAEFLCTCNEFWWGLNNVAKGLWREEIPYVQDMLNLVIRPELIKLLSWRIGIATKFSCSIGKSGKYMYHWLPAQMWDDFLKTYVGSCVNDIWDAVTIMCNLFEDVEVEVAHQLQFAYNVEEAKASRYFLDHVRQLPKDATEIFKT